MKINEIFYSIQGEGWHAGTAAVFVRFSGCNLRCPFCDTKHQESTDMTEDQIIDEVLKYPARLVVLTGGEPTLQVTQSLVEELQSYGKYVAVETNGTRMPDFIPDWITLSPKFEFVKGGKLRLKVCNELKVVWTGKNDMAKYNTISARQYYIQPCDTGNAEENAKIVAEVVEFVKKNPKWHISLQTQKILNIR